MKGDKESNGLIENAVMLLCGIIRTIKCHSKNHSGVEKNGADLGTKALSKVVIAKHFITLGYVNMAEENV